MKSLYRALALVSAVGFVSSLACSEAGPTDGSVPPGDTEPVFDMASQSLILTDNFDQYSSLSSMLNAYPANRGTQFMELIAGRGAAGKAARLKYGIGAADDIVFGPESRLGSVGSWNAALGLPKKKGPYTHFYFTTWFR